MFEFFKIYICKMVGHCKEDNKIGNEITFMQFETDRF